MAAESCRSVAAESCRSVAAEYHRSVAAESCRSVAAEHRRSVAAESCRSVAAEHRRSVAAEHRRSVAAESCRSMAISIKIATFWKTVQTWVSDHHARIVQSAKSTTAGAGSIGTGGAPSISTSVWQAHGINWIWMEGPTVSHTISNGDFIEAALKRDTPGLIEITINAQQFEWTYYFDCTSQGLNIVNGTTVEGRSSPGTFYMALNVEGLWEFGVGDPPADSSIGIGGAVPLIVNGKLYGTTNIYSNDAPTGAPSIGRVPPEFEKFLLQKSSTGFTIQNNKTLGKTIVGYNSTTKQFIIGVQENGIDGLDLETIRDFYVSWGFDNVFSFVGSNSSTLVLDSWIIVDPAHHKNASIPIGITFTIAQ